MAEPMRFVAFDGESNRLAESNDPQEVQRAAEAYAAEHKGEHVHLYQHVISVKASEDGD